MPIRNQAEIESRINAIVTRLVADFDLAWMTFKNTFDPAIDGDRIVCQTFCDWEYRQASFKWNAHQVASMHDDEIEATAIHELVHCLNACLWESLPERYQNSHNKLNELATENVARLITHLYKEKNVRP